jgi:hypothetical protein
MGVTTSPADLPDSAATPSVASKPDFASSGSDTATQLASAAGSSASQSPPMPDPAQSSAPATPSPSPAPAKVSVVATMQVSEMTGPAAPASCGHNHRLFAWLCPFKSKDHQVLPSSQIYPLSYPTSYDSGLATPKAPGKHVHATSQSDSCEATTAAKKPCFLKTWLHTKAQGTLATPQSSPQTDVVTEMPAKKPCFLKTWLHTNAQASLEAPQASAQAECIATTAAPKKPCFLKQWFHHSASPTVMATPQVSPQSPVVETVAVKKPCFLKTFFHKFERGTSGCHCAGCLESGSHCCCESQRLCKFKHHTVTPTGQSTVTLPTYPASQAAATQTNGKTDVVRTSSSSAEADDVAEEGKLGSAAAADSLDKAPQG